MKFLLLLGGLLGFVIGLAFSWAEQGSGQDCLWHACVAAYVGALLMRWWGTAWRKSLAEALQEKQEAQMSSPVKLSSLSKANKS